MSPNSNTWIPREEILWFPTVCPFKAISFPADEALMENLRELREKYGRKKQGTQEA